ncbi:MAG: hypothetical protein U5K69_30240 [Balneolaceae bacterium]|nr:hypothetical protein [Balneolaceae bacterium]
MYAFFQRHLNNPGSPQEQDLELLSNEEMQVTATGQVATAREGETVFSLNSRRADRQLRELNARRKDLKRHLAQVLCSARQLSGYREPQELQEPVFTGKIRREGFVIEKYFIRGEGGYPIPYLLFRPNKPTNKAVLYLHPDGKIGEAEEGDELRWLALNGYTVLIPDLVGIGEMGPGDLANYTTQVQRFESTSFDIWPLSVLLGRSIVGIRAGDVVRLSRLLERQPEIDQVYGVARDEMAPVLLHAAAFEPGIRLIRPIGSVQSMVPW